MLSLSLLAMNWAIWTLKQFVSIREAQFEKTRYIPLRIYKHYKAAVPNPCPKFAKAIHLRNLPTKPSCPKSESRHFTITNDPLIHASDSYDSTAFYFSNLNLDLNPKILHYAPTSATPLKPFQGPSGPSFAQANRPGRRLVDSLARVGCGSVIWLRSDWFCHSVVGLRCWCRW